MIYEAFQDKLFAENWRVEAIGEDGECYVILFCGPDADKRAIEYAEWMNSKKS